METLLTIFAVVFLLGVAGMSTGGDSGGGKGGNKNGAKK